MSAKPARHLALVELDDGGEIVGRVESDALKQLEAKAEKLAGDLKNAEKDLRAKRRRISELERDRILERLEHPDRDFIVRVCRYWHRRSRTKDWDGPKRIDPLAPDRFDAVAALAEMEKIVVVEVDGKRRRERRWRYEAEHFKAAIDGNEFDPFETTHKNGKLERHNDLSQTCRDVTRFERAIEKAPYVTGTFRDGDLMVPTVPGFARLSPPELARAREARNNSSGFQARGDHPSPQVGGSHAGMLGSGHGRVDPWPDPGRPRLRVRVAAGAEVAPG